jgi:hypothetical protein
MDGRFRRPVIEANDGPLVNLGELKRPVVAGNIGRAHS